MQSGRAWMSWSSGKDSALALHAIRRLGGIEVTGLLTTLDASVDRVAMHAVRHTLLQAQADALDLPLVTVELPRPCADAVYEQRMAAAMAAAVDDNVEYVVFGDLHLQDVRAYREKVLAGTGISPLFPLWQRQTDRVAIETVTCGIRAVITCVDPTRAPVALAGRWYDIDLIANLPSGVDPCGENGEFHTFVVDGPDFARPLDVVVGDVVERDGFISADLLPADPLCALSV